MALREPIGCNEEEAMRYLGCSVNMFAEYRRKRIILPLRKGWFAYVDLDRAIERIREDRDKVIKLSINEETEGQMESVEDTLGSQGHKPRIRKTADILRGLGG